MFENCTAYSGFSVNDIDAAKAFYQDVLGIKLTDLAGMGFNLEFPHGHKVFVYPKADHQPASFTILNFPVVDIDAAVDSLAEKGVTCLNYDNPHMPQDDKAILRGLSVNMGPDIAWFTDPAGNILAVLQES